MNGEASVIRSSSPEHSIHPGRNRREIPEPEPAEASRMPVPAVPDSFPELETYDDNKLREIKKFDSVTLQSYLDRMDVAVAR